MGWCGRAGCRRYRLTGPDAQGRLLVLMWARSPDCSTLPPLMYTVPEYSLLSFKVMVPASRAMVKLARCQRMACELAVLDGRDRSGPMLKLPLAWTSRPSPAPKSSVPPVMMPVVRVVVALFELAAKADARLEVRPVPRVSVKPFRKIVLLPTINRSAMVLLELSDSPLASRTTEFAPAAAILVCVARERARCRRPRCRSGSRRARHPAR